VAFAPSTVVKCVSLKAQMQAGQTTTTGTEATGACHLSLVTLDPSMSYARHDCMLHTTPSHIRIPLAFVSSFSVPVFVIPHYCRLGPLDPENFHFDSFFFLRLASGREIRHVQWTGSSCMSRWVVVPNLKRPTTVPPSLRERRRVLALFNFSSSLDITCLFSAGIADQRRWAFDR
jgi:hypothetical protein